MRTFIATAFLTLLATDIIPNIKEPEDGIFFTIFMTISFGLCLIQDIKEITK